MVARVWWQFQYAFWVLWLTGVDDFWLAWDMAAAGWENEAEWARDGYGMGGPYECAIEEMSYWVD